MNYTETVLFHTGDLLGDARFVGCATLNVAGRITGTVYVVAPQGHYDATIEEVGNK